MSTFRARPKSRILAKRSARQMILSGFRSPWMSPSACGAASALEVLCGYGGQLVRRKEALQNRERGSPLLRNSSRQFQWDELETERFRLGAQLSFLALLITQLISGKAAFIKLLTGSDQVEDNPS